MIHNFFGDFLKLFLGYFFEFSCFSGIFFKIYFWSLLHLVIFSDILRFEIYSYFVIFSSINLILYKNENLKIWKKWKFCKYVKKMKIFENMKKWNFLKIWKFWQYEKKMKFLNEKIKRKILKIFSFFKIFLSKFVRFPTIFSFQFSSIFSIFFQYIIFQYFCPDYEFFLKLFIFFSNLAGLDSEANIYNQSDILTVFGFLGWK